MTRRNGLTRGSSQRFLPTRAILLGVVSLVAGCAAVDSLPPERLAELRSKAKACSEVLPDIARYDVDRSGNVQASAGGTEAALIERNFQDCVAARGRWTTWVAGQPPPMLEPLGTENPDSPALRIP
jgi:hypothetical protein